MSTLTTSEWATRKKRIDPQLAASGWLVEAFDGHISLSGCAHHALTEFPTANGPADYALVAGQPLGVVEAKKLTLGPQNVLTQAERFPPRVGGQDAANSNWHPGGSGCRQIELAPWGGQDAAKLNWHPGGSGCRQIELAP